MSSISQADIIQLLNLHYYAKELPAPPFGNQQEDMLVLDDFPFTTKALHKSLSEASTENIQKVLKYKGGILTHNNLGGRDGMGSEQGIRIILISANYEVMKKIIN